MIPRAIIPDLHATDRWQAIEELVNALADRGVIEAASRLGVARAIRLREATSTTGIGCGTALPHATVPLVSRQAVAFGRSKAGIDFDSPDRQLVHCILLFVTPQGEFQAHLNLLAGYSKLFHDDGVRVALCSAQDAAEIESILRTRLA